MGGRGGAGAKGGAGGGRGGGRWACGVPWLWWALSYSLSGCFSLLKHQTKREQHLPPPGASGAPPPPPLPQPLPASPLQRLRPRGSSSSAQHSSPSPSPPSPSPSPPHCASSPPRTPPHPPLPCHRKGGAATWGRWRLPPMMSWSTGGVQGWGVGVGVQGWGGAGCSLPPLNGWISGTWQREGTRHTMGTRRTPRRRCSLQRFPWCDPPPFRLMACWV